MGFTDDVYAHFDNMRIGKWEPISKVCRNQDRAAFMATLIHFIQTGAGEKQGYSLELDGTAESPETHTMFRKIPYKDRNF